MALVKTFDANDLLEEFKAWNRDYFSYEACEELINLFEECDCGTNTELDIVALCCDFTEADPQDIYEDYNNLDDIADCLLDEQDEPDGTDVDEDKLLDALNYHTWAVQLSNGNILYQNF